MVSVFFKPNDLVDVKAANNSWLVSRVHEITDSEVRVTYDGWGPDVHSVPINSKKVKFLRTHTRLYTGNPKFRRSGQVRLDEIDLQYRILGEYFNRPLGSVPPEEFILYFRGELPIFIERLIEVESDECDEAILKFFEKCLELVVKFFEEFVKGFEEFYGLVKDPEKFLVSSEFAVASSLNDFIDILKKILGLNPRCQKFFTRNPKHPNPSNNSEHTIQDPEYSQYSLHLLDHFLSIHGFESITHTLTCTQAQTKSPIQILSGICFQAFQKNIKPEVFSKLNQALKQGIKARCEDLTETDLKYLEIKTLSSLFEGFEEEPELSQQLISIYVKLIKSPFLEKRVKAMTELSALIKSASEDHSKKSLIFTCLTSENLIKDILETRPHEEILKRSPRILRLMSQFGSLGKVECRILTEFVRNGTEKETKAALKIFKLIAQHLDDESLLFTFESLSSVGPDKLNLPFLVEFCLKSNKQRLVETCEQFFLSLLFERPNFGFAKIASKCLKGLYSEPTCQELAEKFIRNLTQMLENLDLVPQITEISLSIFSDLSNDQFLEYCSQFSIKDIVIQNLLKFCKTSNCAASARKAQISSRLEFLQFIFTHSSYTISLKTSEFAELWDYLVKKPVFSEDSQVFLSYLTTGLIKNQKKVFKKFFLDKFNCKNLSIQEILTFKHFFFTANHKKSLIVKDQNLVCVKNDEILGLDQLITMYLSSNDRSCKYILPVLFTFFRVYEKNCEKFLIFHKNLEKFLSQIDCTDPICVKRALSFFSSLLDLKPEKGKTGWFVACIGEDYRKICLPVKGRVREIRKKLAKIVKKPLNCVAFRLNDSVFSHVNDFFVVELLEDSILFIEKCKFGVEELDTAYEFSQNQSVREIIFQKLLKNEEFQQIVWEFVKNLPTLDYFREALWSLQEDVEFPQDFHEFLHLLTALKPLSQDQDWFELFLCSKFPEKIFDFFIWPVKAFPFFVAQSEIFLEILPVFPVSEDYAENLYYYFLNMLLKTFPLVDHLDNPKKFIENCEKTVNRYELTYKLTLKKVTNAFLPSFFQQLMPSLLQTELSKSVIKGLKAVLLLICKESENLSAIFSIFIEPELVYKATNAKKCKIYWDIMKSLMKNRKIPQPQVSNLYFTLEEQAFRLTENENTKICLDFMLKIMKSALKCLKPPPNCNILQFFQVFLAGSEERGSISKCVSVETRTAAFNFILTHCKLVPDTQFGLFLKQFFCNLSWRTSKNWRMSMINVQKTQSFTGIKNLGNTCYLASLFQQLFFIPQLRESVLCIETTDSQSVLFQTKKMFMKLKYLSLPSISPKSFCSNFLDYENHPLSPSIQMDIDEFLCQLLDKLDSDLKPSSPSLIQQLFGFHTSIHMQSSCSHQSSRTEFMLTLPIDIKSSKSLTSSLFSLIEGEKMQGDNSYYCENCSQKVSSCRKTSFQSLPNYFVFVLRRFEFDYDSMQRKKLEDRFEFEFSLDLKEVTSEFLNHEKLPDEDYFKFDLHGIVVHIGKADKGHYVSLIKGEVAWMQFNDGQVSEIGDEEIFKVFGGNEKKHSPCAYLLVYKRRKFFGFGQKVSKNWETGQELVDFEYVKRKNYEYWVKKMALSEDFLRFQLRTVSNLKVFSVQNSVDYFLTVLIRMSKRWEQKISLFQFIVRRIDEKLAEYLLEILCSEQGILEFVLNCPDFIARKFVVLLVKKSLESLETGKIFEYFQHFLYFFKDLLDFPAPGQYLEVFLAFSQKMPEKIELLHLFDAVFCYLLRQPSCICMTKLESSLLGYNRALKNKKVNYAQEPQISSLSAAFEFIEQFLSFCPEERFMQLQTSEFILLLLSKVTTKDSQMSFAKLYRSLSIFFNSNFDPVQFICHVLNTTQSDSVLVKKKKFFIVSEFLSKHPQKVEIVGKTVLMIFSFFCSVRHEDSKYFFSLFLRIFKDNNGKNILLVVGDERLKEVNDFIQRLSEEGGKRLRKVLKKMESDEVDNSDYLISPEIGQKVQVYLEKGKKWVRGRVLDVVEMDLLLVEYYLADKIENSIKWVKGEDISLNPVLE